MIRSIFIILITCVVIGLGAFFVKDKLGFDDIENFNIDKISGSLTKDNSSVPKEVNEHKKEISNDDIDNKTAVYFLKTTGENVKLSTANKKVNSDNDKFRIAMETLFSGPNGIEKITGIYSEIPPQTKLLGIKEDKNSYTINISDDFEIGGGADSMKIRVKQLVQTATQAANGKDVYLEINGKRVDYVGGEGMIILQPLQRNL